MKRFAAGPNSPSLRAFEKVSYLVIVVHSVVFWLAGEPVGFVPWPQEGQDLLAIFPDPVGIKTFHISDHLTSQIVGRHDVC